MSLSDSWLIGCRISIISKARIRYEGFLHSVDVENPDDPAITLSKVWSFGTEDRVCERPVAPRNEEYERIMFRGRDLEDVRLVQSSVFLNEDSAIMSAAPGSSLTSQTAGVHADEKQREDTIRPNLSAAAAANNAGQSLFTSQPLSLDSLNQPSFSAPFAFHNPNASHPNVLGNIQLNTSESSDFRGPKPFGDGRNEIGNRSMSSNKRSDINAWVNPSYSVNYSAASGTRQQTNNFDHPQQRNNRNAPFRGAGSGGNFRGNAGNSYGGPVSLQDNQRNRRGAYNNQWSNQRGMRGTQSGWHSKGMRSGGNHGWGRPHGNEALINTKFSGEYDYEKANAELAAELEKISISAKCNSLDGEVSKEEESTGSATGEDAICYDQSKSFFDTISSELLDRAIGRNPQGMNRHEERMLNSATFGTATSNFYRRGGYGSRGSSGGGGYTHGYRKSGGGYWKDGGRRNGQFSTASSARVDGT